MNQALTLAFQNRARLRRSDLAVDIDRLRPTSAQAHVDIAVPGYVGARYKPGNLCLVSVNPAGGKDNYRPTAGDDRIYSAAAELAAAEGAAAGAAMAKLAQAFVCSMPTWGSQWQHVSAILRAAGAGLEEICYVYLLPYRTRGDSGSALSSAVLARAYQQGFADVLAAIDPKRTIAMDRPSQAACIRWADDGDQRARPLYYTRKRDAHGERQAFLAALRAAAG
jgi:hypothetical protein